MAIKPKPDRPLIGCAGWNISRLHAEKFAVAGSQLERYSRILSAVEINSSFYRPHRVGTYQRWRDTVPSGFRFSVKMPRTITHHARLKKVDELLSAFLAEVNGLSEKLGCLLVQLPPSLTFDASVAEIFFKSLQAFTHTPVVCEPRHPTWFGEDALALMAGLNVALVFADPPIVACRLADVRSQLVYIRLHGSPAIYHSPYSAQYLDRLACDVEAHLGAGRSVWAIFDNTASGAAIPDALSLEDMLKRPVVA